MLRAALKQQANNLDLSQVFAQTTYRDSPLELLGGKTTEDFSLFKFKDAIERSNVAIYHWASWLDAGTAEGVLNHFMSFRNPQKAIIGAWTHGAYKNADPFSPPDTPIKPSREDQLADMVNFLDGDLKDGKHKPKLRPEITYYTMGEEKWKTTRVWPPRGIRKQRWFLADNHDLSRNPPRNRSGQDNYIVNFEATTGLDNRWRQNFENLVFPNRTEEDQKLLTYTSDPVQRDVEITGHPIVYLYLTSTADDVAFFVYLEDVDKNGNVTYITEGQLRALHRKISRDPAPYAVFGPYHSFKQKDGQPLKPGKVSQLSFNLLPTSVLIKKGHRIRITIAGHDKDLFARYPAAGTPKITLQRNAFYPSSIDLPVKSRGRD